MQARQATSSPFAPARPLPLPSISATRLCTATTQRLRRLSHLPSVFREYPCQVLMPKCFRHRLRQLLFNIFDEAQRRPQHRNCPSHQSIAACLALQLTLQVCGADLRTGPTHHRQCKTLNLPCPGPHPRWHLASGHQAVSRVSFIGLAAEPACMLLSL